MLNSEKFKTAEERVKAVEWLTSGDDGAESFCIGLDEEVGKVRKHGGVE